MELSWDCTHLPLNRNPSLGFVFLLARHHLTSAGAQAQATSSAPPCRCSCAEGVHLNLRTQVWRKQILSRNWSDFYLESCLSLKGQKPKPESEGTAPDTCHRAYACLGDRMRFLRLRDGDCLVLELLSPWMVLGEGHPSPCRLLAQVPSHQTLLQGLIVSCFWWRCSMRPRSVGFQFLHHEALPRKYT